MTITVSQVRSWNFESLSAAADGLRVVAGRIDGQRAGLDAEQNVLAESWSGAAAVAAAARIVSETSTLSKLADVGYGVADEFADAADRVLLARRRLEELVDDLSSQDFDVADYGVVTAERIIASLRQMAGPLADDAVLAVQIRTQEATISVCTALEHANLVADDVSERVRRRVSDLEQLLPETATGRVEATDDGGFSWTPDYQAMTAGVTVTVSAASDVTGHGLRTAAAASSDELAHTIGRRLGPAGAVLGTIPAIANDIEGGMDPTKAIVTESAGTVVGVAAGTAMGSITSAAVAGSTIGSVVPGAGTVVGLIVGVGVGALMAYGVPKAGQWLWD